jgi:hypothetical protein
LNYGGTYGKLSLLSPEIGVNSDDI